MPKVQRFTTEVKPKGDGPGYPNRIGGTLSETGLKAYARVKLRFPVLNKAEVVELGILVLEIAADTLVKEVAPGLFKNQKAPAGEAPVEATPEE